MLCSRTIGLKTLN